MPKLPLRWTELATRAVIVSALIAAVVTLSFTIGPEKTGILASFPATFTPTMFVLHRRVGGPATAAVMAHSLVGLPGFSLCMAVLHLAAVPVGAPWALGLALLFSGCRGTPRFFCWCAGPACRCKGSSRTGQQGKSPIASPTSVRRFRRVLPVTACFSGRTLASGRSPFFPARNGRDWR